AGRRHPRGPLGASVLALSPSRSGAHERGRPRRTWPRLGAEHRRAPWRLRDDRQSTRLWNSGAPDVSWIVGCDLLKNGGKQALPLQEHLVGMTQILKPSLFDSLRYAQAERLLLRRNLPKGEPESHHLLRIRHAQVFEQTWGAGFVGVFDHALDRQCRFELIGISRQGRYVFIDIAH